MKRKGCADEKDKQIGQRMRDRRIHLGLTLNDLGQTMDVSYQQVQKYEQGRDRVPAWKLYQASKRLDVPMDYFFEERSGLQVRQ